MRSGTAPCRLTRLSVIGPDVSAIVYVIGLHALHLVIAKDVRYAFESRLIYRNRAEPALPPTECERLSYTALLLAGRKPENQALQPWQGNRNGNSWRKNDALSKRTAQGASLQEGYCQKSGQPQRAHRQA
jgi:hypothetical protein